MQSPLAARASRVLALVAFGASSAAHAHTAAGGGDSFFTGLLHPLSAFDHLLPLIALGMLAGQRGLERAQGLLVAFPLAFAVGILATSLFALPLPLATMSAGTALIAGGLVALSLAMPQRALFLVVILIGATHGFVNAPEIASVSFTTGATLGATLLFAYTFAATHHVLKNAPAWRSVAVRAIGSWIAAFGILTLALSAAPGITA